ncbi:macrophage mannose receptor 1-like [Pangasianodon hypophthalmus]|uniref:macrophage mannose receptor 1-like n=1 Tax=Pangasianodon hypophthalmus TaxID=310915 RepID=UPI0023076371|nr:macrophage mannose receptor 1-like [Pangasianodon hypophthalmus]
MLCFYISLLMVLFGMATGLTREYKYFPMTMNWIDAQNYCRQNYKGLAVITSDEENQRLIDVGGPLTLGWIGMYRSQVDPTIWLWENGKQNSFFGWEQGEPNNIQKIENCAQMSSGGWNDCVCGTPLPFYCYKILVLIKEKKIWEEALDYCRMNYTGLASPASKTQLQLAEMESSQTQTDRVWAGLRFQNGKWLWVSKEPLGTLVTLPACPAPRYRCGALNTKTHVWENRDCNEKLNFLCY